MSWLDPITQNQNVIFMTWHFQGLHVCNIFLLLLYNVFERKRSCQGFCVSWKVPLSFVSHHQELQMWSVTMSTGTPWVALIDFNWSNKPIVFSSREQCILLRLITLINLQLNDNIAHTSTWLGVLQVSHSNRTFQCHFQALNEIKNNNFLASCHPATHTHTHQYTWSIGHTHTHTSSRVWSSEGGVEYVSLFADSAVLF